MDTLKRYQPLIEALRKADAELRAAGRVDPLRKAEETKRIMGAAKESLYVVGINALRPAHEGIEVVSGVLKAGGTVSFTTLDPFCENFTRREEYENTALGRLRSEWEAAVCDLADSYKRAGNKGDLWLYIHRLWPALSLVAADPDKPESAELQLNLYPPKGGIRGLSGKTYQLRLDGSAEGDAFSETIAFLDELKRRSVVRTPKDFDWMVKESKKDWLEQYG